MRLKKLGTVFFLILSALTVALTTRCDNPLQDQIIQDVLESGAPSYQLTIDTSGEGSTTPSGTVTLRQNELIDISAIPGDRYAFVGWVIVQGDGVVIDNQESAETTVKLTQQDATIEAQFRILVTGVSLNKSSIKISQSESEKLTATIEPSDASIQGLSWESNNSGIASVSSDGLVTGISLGSATITVTTDDGELTGTCSVEVTYPPGHQQPYTAGSVNFTLNYVPGGAFPTGSDDSGEATANDFWLGETEATNELVATVYQWAYDENKMDTGTVSNTTVTLFTQELLDLDGGNIQISFSGGTFSVDSGFEDYPCIDITWYGSILFCNWLTEMVNGTTDQIVYSGIDATWVDDETVETQTKTGFRLPSRDEWECAARYLGMTNSGFGIAKGGKYWTPGDHASGATADYTNATATGLVAWYSDNSDTLPNSNFNSGKGTHPVGTAGNGSGAGTPLTGNANQLGIFDMSGNVIEWCFTEEGSFRVNRAGGWVSDRSDTQTGVWWWNYPDSVYYWTGFRYARSE